MHSELSKKKKISFIKTIIAIIIGYFTIMLTRHFTNGIINLKIIDLIIIIVIAVLVYIFIINNLIYYRYTLVKNELIVTRCVGRSEKQKININSREIISIVNNKDEKYNKLEAKKSGKFHAHTGVDRYNLIYMEEGVKKVTQLEMTEGLIKLLQQSK